MATSRSIPSLLVLQSVYNQKYLSYIQDSGPYGGQVHSQLQFEGSEVISPYTKLEVEIASAGNGWVHIRNSYNNKYWGRKVKYSNIINWLAAIHDEKEEDQSKWSCTLFQLESVEGGAVEQVRLRHVQSGRYVCLSREAVPYDYVNIPSGEAVPNYYSCLLAASAEIDTDKCDVFTIIDWNSLVIMPQHVVFKGEESGKYLKAFSDTRSFLQFGSNDIREQYVPNQVLTNGDGSIRLKNNYFNSFWSRAPSDNWIVCDPVDSTGSNDGASYVPVKLSDNVIALRNKGNNMYCKRYTDARATSCLKAISPTIDLFSRLQVEEAVISRHIDGFEYSFADARIYGEKVVVLVTQQATNQTQEPNTVEMDLRKSDTWTSTLNCSVSAKLGVQMTMAAGIPFLAQDTILIQYDFRRDAYEWGKSLQYAYEVGSLYTVTVPPMSMVKVSLIAMDGKCDIPFSYKQGDTLLNGDYVTTEKNDGIYTGHNSFNFRCEAERFLLGPDGNPIMSSGKKMII